jgi:hypothetical protein
MEIVCSSEMFVPTYQTTRRHDTEFYNTKPYRSLNLKLYTSNLSLATGLFISQLHWKSLDSWVSEVNK